MWAVEIGVIAGEAAAAAAATVVGREIYNANPRTRAESMLRADSAVAKVELTQPKVDVLTNIGA